MNTFNSIYILTLTLFLSATMALSPLHEASVQFRPQLNNDNDGESSLLLGQFYSHKAPQKIRVPVNYIFSPLDDFELGFGVKSRWNKEPNNIRHLLVGGKYQASSELSFQVDLMWGVSNYAGDGVSLAVNYQHLMIEGLGEILTFRLGLFDALVWEPDITAFELGWLPQWYIGDKVTVELDFSMASQVGSMADRFSIDVAPGLIYHHNSQFSIMGSVLLGVSGKRKSQPRFQLTEQFYFD